MNDPHCHVLSFAFEESFRKNFDLGALIEIHTIETILPFDSMFFLVYQVFLELNNFNGMQEILGAMNSAPVYRLHLTVAVSTFWILLCLQSRSRFSLFSKICQV